jgi:orotidine-5'-phosphate decarboxylase
MNFHQQLKTTQRKSGSLLCIGLDPDPKKIPRTVRGRLHVAVVEFNRHIIEATKDLVCAYKLNLAFYEALGKHAWETIHATLSHIPSGVVTIGDAKRGDIGNSSEFYAQSLFQEYGFDAATVSPYMGYDSVEPFMRDPQHGVFVLALTSNPGAKDFQHLKSGGRLVFERVASCVRTWNAHRNLGLVAGATQPLQLRRIRTIAPDLPLLIPGIGAQGGDLKSTVRFGCNTRGEMAVINVSRGVLYASGGRDYPEAARTEALRLRDHINEYRILFF